VWEGTADDIELIWARRETENFWKWDWTTRITLTVLPFLLSRRTPEIFGQRAVEALNLHRCEASPYKAKMLVTEDRQKTVFCFVRL
jgi:hypothetical protein